jgi:hypothetical protein
VEHHRTLGDYVRALAGAGFALDDLVEPEWPEGFEQEWGQWSPLRGRLFPGTAIFRCHTFASERDRRAPQHAAPRAPSPPAAQRGRR